MSEDDIETPSLATILEIVSRIEEKIDATVAAVVQVETQVAPMIESLSNSPLFKMLGGRKNG